MMDPGKRLSYCRSTILSTRGNFRLSIADSRPSKIGNRQCPGGKQAGSLPDIPGWKPGLLLQPEAATKSKIGNLNSLRLFYHVQVSQDARQDLYRRLPSMTSLLEDAAVHPLIDRYSRRLVVSEATTALEELREAIRSGALEATEFERRVGELPESLEERLKARPMATLCIDCKKRQESMERARGK